MARRKSNGRGIGASFLGAVAATALSSHGIAEAAPPPLTEDNVIVVDPQGASTIVEEADSGAVTVDERHARWAIGAMLGGLAGAFVAAFGLPKMLGLFASGGRATLRTAAKVSAAPAMAARQAARGITSAVEKSSRTAARTGILTLGALLAIALLDVSWKASLVVGTLSTGAAVFGWRRQNRPTPIPERG